MGLIEAKPDRQLAPMVAEDVIFAFAQQDDLQDTHIPDIRQEVLSPGLVGLVCPSGSAYASCEQRPQLDLKGPVVCLDPGLILSGDISAQEVAADLAMQASRLLAEGARCHEYRIALYSAGPSGIREAVRIAHRLGDLAERTCYTPAPLRPRGEGELLLSASLVVHDDRTGTFLAKLEGMVQFARAAGLCLARSGPHFLQSVTLCHDSNAGQVPMPMRQQG